MIDPSSVFASSDPADRDVDGCRPGVPDCTETGGSGKVSREPREAKLGLRARARVGKVSLSQTPSRPALRWDLSLDAKTTQSAVVTGASSGIGRALAKLLAANGCRVGLIARRRVALEELAAEIQAAGGDATVAPADIGDLAQTRAAVAAIAAIHGPADLLIANAGVGIPTTLDPINMDAVEETIRVNVMGVIYAIDAVMPTMLKRGTGHIAAISSLAAYKGIPGESAYCASKAAVNSYLEGLRVQARRRGIFVTTVCPGFVHTPMPEPNRFVMPFVLEADEAARRIVRALKRKPKVYNFPWQMTALMRVSLLAPDWFVALMFKNYLDDPPLPASHSPARSD
jgi:short-subunit dehydrogenase